MNAPASHLLAAAGFRADQSQTLQPARGPDVGDTASTGDSCNRSHFGERLAQPYIGNCSLCHFFSSILSESFPAMLPTLLRVRVIQQGQVIRRAEKKNWEVEELNNAESNLVPISRKATCCWRCGFEGWWFRARGRIRVTSSFQRTYLRIQQTLVICASQPPAFTALLCLE